MLPNTGNILDQLVGGFDGAASNGSGRAGHAVGSELFGSILAGALGSGINSTGEENCAQPQMLGIPLAGFGQLLGLIDPQNVAGPTVQNGEGTFATPDTLAALADGDPAMVPIDTDEATLVKGQALVESDPSLEFTISNQQLRALLANAPTAQAGALQPGTYQIADFQVKGGHVELTLTSDQGGDPVQVSIPTDVVTAAAAKLAEQNTAGRVPLFDGQAAEADRLSQLLSDLKLKTLEVKLEAGTKAHGDASQSVVVKLVAENSGQEVALRTNIVVQQINAATTDSTGRKRAIDANTLDNLEPDNDGEVNPDSRPSIMTKAGEQTNPLLDKVDPRTLRATLTTSRFDLPEKLAQHNLSDSQLTIGSSAASQKFADITLNTSDRGATPVRLDLQESSLQQLRPGGQSVMLRIEPEHLGPARLNLTFNNHSLTARVTVDSPAAKVAIEHSLDQLNTQLSKAGIQVDRIEVALSGNGAQERFFDRRPHWSTQQSGHFQLADDETDLENAGPTSVYTLPARQYVNAGGVNLWA